MKNPKDVIDWTHLRAGRLAYDDTRMRAQAAANATGCDHGIERNDLFKIFRFFMLPRRESRQGHELRCEVVHPSDLTKCRPGHGP